MGTVPYGATAPRNKHGQFLKTPKPGDPDFDSAAATAIFTGDIRNNPNFNPDRLHSHATCCWCDSPLASISGGRYWRCPRAQCFARQMLFSVRTGSGKAEKMLYLPLPIQVVFIEAVLQQIYPYILFGGAAGGSKSHALRWLAHYLCLLKPGFKVLLLRKTFSQLQESHIIRAEGEAIALGANYIATQKSVVYANDSRLRFGHCENLGDEQNYQGDEYDLVLFDEETHFHEQMITFIASRTRTSRKALYGDDWMPVVAGGTNPGGVGAEYCLSHYITHEVDPDKYEYYDPESYLYIPAKLTNNPYLDKGYLKKLRDLPKARREALINGDWYSFEGMFFEEFSQHDDTHKDGVVLKPHTQETYYGPEFERFCSMDWGYSDKGVVLWWVCLSDGCLHVEDEYVFQRTDIPEVCREILRRNKDRHIRVRYTAASPDLFPQTGQIGESRAETFRRNGVTLRKAKNARVAGWHRIRELLRYRPNGEPTLTINPRTCPYLCRTLPQMVSDPKNAEDVAQHKDDHACESLRYGAMSRPSPTYFSHITVHPPGSAGAFIQEILDDLNTRHPAR